MFKSLTLKISALLLCMVVLSTVAIGLASYILYRSVSISINADKAANVADTIAFAIDGDKVEHIMQTMEKDDYWYTIKQFVDNTAVKLDLKYMYILGAEHSNNVTYFVEGYNPGTLEPEFDLGDIEPVSVHSEQLFEVLDTGKTISSELYDSGEFGMLVSGFAPIKNSAGSVVGVVGVDFSVEDVLASSQGFLVRMLVIMLISCVIFGVVCVYLINRVVGKPIRELTEASRRVARGDVSIELDINSQDEIGELARSFLDIVASSREQARVLESLAEGDLSMDITPRSDHDITSLAIKKTIGSLNQIFYEIQDSIVNVSDVAMRISEGSTTLASGATEQSAIVSQLMDTIRDIAVRTGENANMAAQAAQLAGDVISSAEQGSVQMGAMLRAVQDIETANLSISRGMKAIDDIAFQTNILALNAAVEAAHAGQHGRGFAVVAEEVRGLAEKSAGSAKDSADLVENSISKVELGVKIAGDTSSSLEEIVAGIRESSRIVGGIAVSSQEQREAIENINRSVEQVMAVVHSNSATAEQSAAASAEMNAQSETLRALLENFRLHDRGSSLGIRENVMIGSGSRY